MLIDCADCERKFKSKKSLSDHRRIHTGEKPFVWQPLNSPPPPPSKDCQKQFTQFSTLQKHERTHTGEKPYRCLDCDSAFAQISNLHRHIKTHKNEKPFTCPTCSRNFSTSSNLKQHQATHETQRKSLVCNQHPCDKQFLYSSSLRKHIKAQHFSSQKQIIDEHPTQPSLKFLDDFFLDCNSNPFFFDFSFQNLEQSKLNVIEQIKDFFTSRHLKIFHDSHIDILFNGRLYNYNDETGKIEQHALEETIPIPCNPVSHEEHKINKNYQEVGCISCSLLSCNAIVLKKQQVKQEKCAGSCCLACNGGACKNAAQKNSKKEEEEVHEHGPNCGHPFVYHQDHIDYLVNEVLHYPHESHCDNHGILRCLEQGPQ